MLWRFLLSTIARNATKSRSVTVLPSDSSSEESSTANLPRTMGRPRSGDFLRLAAAFLRAPPVGLGVRLLIVAPFFGLMAWWTKQRHQAEWVLRLPARPVNKIGSAYALSSFSLGLGKTRQRLHPVRFSPNIFFSG